MNDAPVPIPGCQNGPGQSCALADFQTYVNSRGPLMGDFVQVCGLSNVTNAPDVVDFYNNPVSKLANTSIFTFGVEPLIGVPNPFGS